MNINRAKIWYLKGLAAKKVSSKKALDRFHESVKQFAKVLEIDSGFWISQVFMEMAEVSKKEN